MRMAPTKGEAAEAAPRKNKHLAKTLAILISVPLTKPGGRWLVTLDCPTEPAVGAPPVT